MTVDTALTILLFEALAGLVIIALAFVFIQKKKRNLEMQAINQFIDQFNEERSHQHYPMADLLTGNYMLDKKTAANILQDINESERGLILAIVKLFLQREMSLLSEIDHKLNTLSNQYQSLMGQINPTQTTSTSIGKHGLEHINQQLIRQLDIAMKTIDEITTEYTRVFSGKQTELELENSRKRMLQIFQDTEATLLQGREI